MKAFVCALVALLCLGALAATEQSACSVCEIVVQVVENVVADKKTESEVEAKLESLCQDLPAPYNSECVVLVSTYFDEIYQFVLKKENPANICMQIGACSPTRVVKRAAEQSPCAICELVVQMAETYLENNATEQQLQQKLDSICADLPAPYGGECVLIVNAYLPQIVEWIEANEPPHTLCAQLSLCASASRGLLKALKAAKKESEKRSVEQSPCALCQIVVQMAENWLATNKSVASLEKKLEGLCTKLPSPYSGECTLIVDNYLPQIVSYLENKEPPSRICAQIKLCSNLTQPVKRAAQQSACDICELVVQMAENYLQQNATEQQILAKLDSVCERLPSPYGQECDLLVAAYLAEVIEWIATNEKPAAFCAQIALCSSVPTRVVAVSGL